MTTWKFTITERSIFYVDLETEEEEKATEKIREMLTENELRIERPDEYESEDTIEVAEE